jgi:ParB family chromosome partitioning protein
MIALVQVLAAYEEAMPKGAWRHDGTGNATGRYLRFLGQCGYTLSEVEEYAISAQEA